MLIAIDAAPEQWREYGVTLRTERQRQGLSRAALAQLASVSPKSVQTAESGRVPKSRAPYTLDAIERALGIGGCVSPGRKDPASKTVCAPGPCPVDGCDWDAEGTLDDHLFTQHDEEDLAKVVVRLTTENNRLRAVIQGVRDLCAEYSEAEGRGLAPRGSAFAHWVRSAVTDPAPAKTEG